MLDGRETEYVLECMKTSWNSEKPNVFLFLFD